MTSDSKIFVGLRSTGKKKVAQREPVGPRCQWDDCEKSGAHRAPVGRGAEGLYLLFCTEHVKTYNRGYNFSPNLSDPETARYQREAAAGSRPTVGTSIPEATDLPLPSKVRSGSAKATNARKAGILKPGESCNTPKRKLKALEAKAFAVLDLSPDSTPEEIKNRYKQRLKMHHPDTNNGDRDSEEILRASIDAHRILKLNGYC